MTQFMMIGLLFCYALFFKHFEAEYGWSRTLLSACISFASVVSGVFAFYGGKLSDRFGPAPVLAVAGVMGGASFILLAMISAPWQLFVFFGLLYGLGMSTHDVATLSTIARLFQKRRGIMTGVVKVGTASGQIVMPLIAAFLIATYDWKTALVMLGSGGMVVLLIAALLMKRPTGATAVTSQQTEAGGMAFAEARRTPTFWMICIIQFCFFCSLMTIPLHIVVHGMDLGLSAAPAAALLSVSGAASIIGRLSVGGLIDRFGGKRSLVFCFLPLLVGLGLFLVISVPEMLFVGIAIYGVGHGGFFTVMSPTIAQYFGLKAHGSIFGFVLFCGMFGGALGPVLTGWIFDAYGSYTMAFMSLGTLGAIGLVLALRLPSVGLYTDK